MGKERVDFEGVMGREMNINIKMHHMNLLKNKNITFFKALIKGSSLLR